MFKVEKELLFKNSNDYYNIYFLGDFHIGSLMFDDEVFLKIRDHIKKDKRAKIIFIGDMFELDSSVIRQRRKGFLFIDRQFNYPEEDLVYLDKIDKYIKDYLDFLTPDNTLCVLDGNHYRLFANGYTDVEYFCIKKKLTYCGTGETNLFIRCRTEHSRIRLISAKIFHSHNNGKNQTSDLNFLIQKVNGLEGYDILAKAHTHRPINIPYQKDVANCNTDLGFEKKDIWLINTASTRKYRELNNKLNENLNKRYFVKNSDSKIKLIEPDYAEKSNYNIVSYAIPYITITMKAITENKNGKRYGNKIITLEGKYLNVY